jgi:2-dehydropantoate 2-reductase
MSLLWSKLVISAAINPISALSDLTNGEILKSSDLTEVMHEAASEAEEVANIKGIKLQYKNAADEADEICRATKNNISSMLQDVRAGRKTEIESITGAIIKEANAMNVDVPTNEVLMKRINKLSEQAQ